MMEGFLQEVVMELCRLPAEKVKKKKNGQHFREIRYIRVFLMTRGIRADESMGLN